MRPYIIGLCCVAGVLAMGKWISVGLSLLNQASDWSVAVGVVMLFGAFAIAVAVGRAVAPFCTAVLDTVRRWSGLLLLCCLLPFLAGCMGCTVVSPGEVGIKVNMIGQARGVDELPLVTGWTFYNPLTQRVFSYPTYVQTAIWSRDGGEELSFNSKEGLTITGDISLSYQLDATRVPHFYVKFRTDDLNRFTHGFLRNVARDQFNEVAGTYSVEALYGPDKEKFLTAVRDRLNTSVADIGVRIEQFGFIGAPRPPQTVVDAINMKITATQNAMRAENELRQATAEAQKAVAKAEGEAKANRALAESVTPQLLNWRYLQNMQEAIAKWDGRRPTVEGVGSGLLLQLPGPIYTEPRG